MGCLVAILAACFPRLTVALVYLLSTFFERATSSPVVFALLGLFVCPLTVLWYCAVQNWFDGGWGCFQIVVLLVCVAADFGGGKVTVDAGRRDRGASDDE